MQRALKIAHPKWVSLLLSFLFCIPIAFISTIALFNLLDKIYSIRNLILVAFGIGALLIWVIWFIVENFLSWLRTKYLNITRRDYLLLMIALLPVITALYIVFINYGGQKIYERFSSKFEVKIGFSNESNPSGNICILEFKSNEGTRIQPENKLTSQFLITGGRILNKPNCRYFLQGSSHGSLSFHYVGKPGEFFQILFRENKDSGKSIIRINGEQIAEIDLRNDLEGNKPVSVPLQFSPVQTLFWNIVGMACWTAILAILVMVFALSFQNVSLPSPVGSLFDLIPKYPWISLIPIVVIVALMFWPSVAYVSPDVGYYLSLAKNLYHGNGYVNPDLSPNIYRGPVFPLLISLSYSFFGEMFRSALILERIFWALTILISYVLGRQLFNQHVGLLASFLVLSSIAINRAFYFIWTDGPVTFMILMLQWLFWEAFNKYRGSIWYVLMGVTTGIAYLIKQSAIFIMPLPFLMWIVFSEYRTRQSLKKILVYYTIFAIFFFGWMGYVYLMGGSSKQVAGDLNVGLSVISRLTSILSAKQTLSTKTVASYSTSLSLPQTLVTYYNQDIAKFFRIAPVILIALGFTLFQAIFKKSKPDIQLGMGLLLFSTLIPTQVIANFGFRQDLYFYVIGMICIAALIERLFHGLLSSTISSFIMLMVTVSLIVIQVSGSYFLRLNPIPITDQKTLNYFSNYQAIADWVDNYVKPDELILISSRQSNYLHILTDGNRQFEIINTCLGEIGFSPAVKCTPPYISFWVYQGISDPENPRDFLQGISETLLMSTIRDKDVKYVFVTPDVYSLYSYLKIHPDFKEVTILDNTAVFRVIHPVHSILADSNVSWKMCIGKGTPEYLNNLKETEPARYETKLREQVEPWMGLTRQDLEGFINWKGCQFEVNFPGSYHMP